MLTSLIGGPKERALSIGCNNNKLTSFVGSPKNEVRDFYCMNNNITDFDGMPEVVGWSVKPEYSYFSCQGNPISSFKGVKTVLANFTLSNTNISDLEGAPNIPDKCMFTISKTKIKSLDDLKSKPTGEIILKENTDDIKIYMFESFNDRRLDEGFIKAKTQDFAKIKKGDIVVIYDEAIGRVVETLDGKKVKPDVIKKFVEKYSDFNEDSHYETEMIAFEKWNKSDLNGKKDYDIVTLDFGNAYILPVAEFKGF